MNNKERTFRVLIVDSKGSDRRANEINQEIIDLDVEDELGLWIHWVRSQESVIETLQKDEFQIVILLNNTPKVGEFFHHLRGYFTRCKYVVIGAESSTSSRCIEFTNGVAIFSETFRSVKGTFKRLMMDEREKLKPAMQPEG